MIVQAACSCLMVCLMVCLIALICPTLQPGVTKHAP